MHYNYNYNNGAAPYLLDKNIAKAEVDRESKKNGREYIKSKLNLWVANYK